MKTTKVEWIGLHGGFVRHIASSETSSVCGYIRSQQHDLITRDVLDRKACQSCAHHLAEILIKDLKRQGFNA